MKYKIIADSSSNLQFYNIKNVSTVPLKIRVEDKEYVDDENLDVKALVDHLKAYKGKISSSCPNTQEWIEAFDDAKVVFLITITSKLSGSYNAAVLAKEECSDREVYVIDSLAAGPHLKMIAEYIVECLESGLSGKETYKKVSFYEKRMHTDFALASVDNLAKNGRISSVVATAVGLLNLRIVGQAIDGVLEPQHKVRGDKKAMKTLLESMESRGYNGGYVSISDCFNEKATEILKELILKKYPQAHIEIVKCGGLMSYYQEFGGVVVGYEG